VLTHSIGFGLAAAGLLALAQPSLVQSRLAWLGRERLSRGATSASIERSRPSLRRWLDCGPRKHADEAELAVVVAAIADEYAAGATSATAFSAAARTAARYRDALMHAARLASAGEEVSAALAADSALSGLSVACAVAGQAGTPLATVLHTVRADLLADHEVRRAVQTALAGPRASATLLALLPVVGIAMGIGMGADPVRVLLHTAPGMIAATLGVLLDLGGMLWTFALARRALP
jgi:tight adherence protein B